MFVLIQLAYQFFYETKDVSRQGSMCQLRNIINRRDVSGSGKVIESFR